MLKKSLLKIVITASLCASLFCSCTNSTNEANTTNTTATEADTSTEETTTEEANNEEATNETNDEATTEDVSSDEADTDSIELLSGKHHVEINVKDYGTMKLELDADVAPISVTNFVDLANSGFYDGLTFHRIITGFMIQGGDPLADGTGGAKKFIKGEFASNGIENNISHTRGVISMARGVSPDSASSQFFIVHEDSTSLDGNYAAFGIVTEGIEIVDKICDDTPVIDDNGSVAKENQPTIESIKVID